MRRLSYIIFLSLLLSHANAELSMIIDKRIGDELFCVINDIGYVRLTADSMFVCAADGGVYSRSAYVDIRKVVYGDRQETSHTQNEDVTAITQNEDVTAITVFPNPAADELVIDNLRGETIRLFSLDGKVLQTVSNVNGRYTLIVSHLPQATYLLLINTQSIKFIKK